MSLRKYLRENDSPHPHIGHMIKNVMTDKKVSQAELARRMQVTSSSVANYFLQSSLQFGILWNISLILEYDFLSELISYYPANLPPKENTELIKKIKEKEDLIGDLEKEIQIYKKTLGIKD